LAQYFDNVDLKSELRKIDVRIFDMNFSFYSDNGVFAKDKLDFGTRLMLENIDWDNVSGPILDVGCGYGPIGIIASKITGSVVTMCDVNKRAVHLTERNIKENGVDCEVTISDCYENIGGIYNTIITNPPIRAGKKVVYDIVMNAQNYLENDGVLFLVIRKEQGAKSLIVDLEKQYTVEVLNKKKGFYILKCKRLS
jgi:16S rRNA (guanine1207-N2)-methyltransferase